MDLLLGEDEIGELFQEIELAVENHKKEIGIFYKGGHKRRTNFNEKTAAASYLKDFFEFPLDIITGQKEVVIYRTFYERETWRLGFYDDQNSEDIKDSILAIDELISQQENEANFIWCKMSEKFQSVERNYLKCLKQAAIRLGFSENTPEETILITLLNHYQRILDRSDIQLKVFDGLIISKDIADLYTQVWIAFLKRQLQMIAPVLLDRAVASIPQKLPQVVWTGSQKELAELFVELENKGWIEPCTYGNRAKIAKAILQLFDISGTKRSASTDESKSFAQIYKGEPDTNNIISKSFPAIYTQRYKKKFNQIISKL